MKKEYIGDSVYIEFDGFGLIMTTENGRPTDPSNEIYLEPEVFQALIRFAKKWGMKVPEGKGV
jgi:hypothetical protein